jgi:hypothetical protein
MAAPSFCIGKEMENMKESFFRRSGVAGVARMAVDAWRLLSTRTERSRLLAKKADLLAEKSYLTGLAPERFCHPEGEAGQMHAENNRKRAEVDAEIERLGRGKRALCPRPVTAVDALNA